MSARPSSFFRAGIASAILAASAGVHAASFSVAIPPWGTSTYSFPQCASYSWDGSTLSCVAAGSPPPGPPSPPPPGGATPFAGCPGDALKIDGQWGNAAISTFDFGYFSTNILSIRVAVPSTATGSRIRTSSWVEYGTAPIAREAVFSRVACDFSDTYALRTSLGTPAKVPGGAQSFAFKYTFGTATTSAVKLIPGEVYYINVRNRYGDGSLSCPLTACSMRGGLPP